MPAKISREDWKKLNKPEPLRKVKEEYTYLELLQAIRWLLNHFPNSKLKTCTYESDGEKWEDYPYLQTSYGGENIRKKIEQAFRGVVPNE